VTKNDVNFKRFFSKMAVDTSLFSSPPSFITPYLASLREFQTPVEREEEGKTAG